MTQFRLVPKIIVRVGVVQRASWLSGQWVAAGWQRRLQALRDCRIADSRVCADTTAVIPEIAGSHRLLLVEIIAALARTCIQFIGRTLIIRPNQ